MLISVMNIPRIYSRTFPIWTRSNILMESFVPNKILTL